MRFKSAWWKNRNLRSKNLVFWYDDWKAWFLNLKTFSIFDRNTSFTAKYLVFRSKYHVSQNNVTNGFHNLGSKVWWARDHLPLYSQFTWYLQARKSLGRNNLKNRYRAIQNVRYSESEEEVFKKLTKNIIGRRGCSQKSDITQSNKFCVHFFSNLNFAFMYVIRLG